MRSLALLRTIAFGMLVIKKQKYSNLCAREQHTAHHMQKKHRPGGGCSRGGLATVQGQAFTAIKASLLVVLSDRKSVV